jgi:hypothetical protein
MIIHAKFDISRFATLNQTADLLLARSGALLQQFCYKRHIVLVGAPQAGRAARALPAHCASNIIKQKNCDTLHAPERKSKPSSLSMSMSAMQYFQQ